MEDFPIPEPLAHATLSLGVGGVVLATIAFGIGAIYLEVRDLFPHDQSIQKRVEETPAAPVLDQETILKYPELVLDGN